MIYVWFNLALDLETALVGVSMFSIFSTICSSITARCAQCRSAQR
jgi:hypothetical protein